MREAHFNLQRYKDVATDFRSRSYMHLLDMGFDLYAISELLESVRSREEWGVLPSLIDLASDKRCEVMAHAVSKALNACLEASPPYDYTPWRFGSSKLNNVVAIGIIIYSLGASNHYAHYDSMKPKVCEVNWMRDGF